MTPNIYFSPSLIDHFTKMRYTLIGRGADSLVFISPNRDIVKIVGANKTEAHRIVDKWVEFCKKHSDTHLLPQHITQSAFIYEDNDYVQVRMERLFRLPSSMEDSFEQVVDHILASSIIDDAKELIAADSEEHPGMVEVLNAVENFDELFVVVKALDKIAESNGWDLDLHSDNAMLDDHGKLVIIDPWYY